MPETRPSAPEPRTLAAALLPEATRRLVRTADSLADHDLGAPSLLPGWTRAHVLAHLALNAEALAGAATGVVEGRSVPMYASQEARDRDIEELAVATPAEVRSRLMGACTALSDALAAVPDDATGTDVERVPGGRTFTVADVPVMRWIEVEVHHADLGAGYDRSQWPLELCVHLLDSHLGDGQGSPAADGSFTAYAVDLDRTWSAGAGGPRVAGTAADLAWWLTGRGSGEGLTCDGGSLPQIGAW